MCDCTGRHVLRDSLGRFRRHDSQSIDRAEYLAYLDARYLAAEAATRGHLLTAEGLARGVRPSGWFDAGRPPAARYASEELRTWLTLHPVLTHREYLAQVADAA